MATVSSSLGDGGGRADRSATLTGMDVDEAKRLLAEHEAARDALLTRLTAAATKAGRSLWQVGSLAEDRGDAWTDLDLVVTDGPCLVCAGGGGPPLFPPPRAAGRAGGARWRA